MTTVLFILCILAALALILFALGALARARLKRKYPPAGQMIDIGGHRLHLHVEGEGSPTVVLEAGAGGIGLSWELVRPVIAKATRVVVYDRAGLGWSEPGPDPRSAGQMAEELHSLLNKAGIEGPYILVGHSLGGMIARQFAKRYPQEVTGLVMVDSAHEQQVKRFPEALVRMVNSMKGMMGVMKLAGRLGVMALNPGLIALGDNGRLPAGTAAQMRGVMASSESHAEAMIAETEAANSGLMEPVDSLGDLPLTVISHGRLDENAVPPGLGPEVRDDYERAWQELQKEITALSTRGRQIIAGQSGHNIMFDEPQVIIDAILEMLAASREHGPFFISEEKSHVQAG